MLTVCEAIARQEGWLVPDSLCRRNRNPGNVRYGTFALRHGASGENEGFAIFPTDQQGFDAQSELLEAWYVGLTLAQAIYKYAPPSDDNPTEAYISDLEVWTGLTRMTILTPALLAPPVIA